MEERKLTNIILEEKDRERIEVLKKLLEMATMTKVIKKCIKIVYDAEVKKLK